MVAAGVVPPPPVTFTNKLGLAAGAWTVTFPVPVAIMPRLEASPITRLGVVTVRPVVACTV